MSDITDNTPKIWCPKHYIRCPYTHTQQVFDLCCIGCEKPGAGSSDHNPYDNSCTDLALCCIPCAFLADIICCFPMVFGYCVVGNHKI